MNIQSSSKQRNRRGNLAEFGPVLFVFVVLILLPLANLIFYSIGIIGTQFLVSEAARAASSGDTRDKANNAMALKAQQCLGTGILMVAKVKPVGGFNGQGCTLYCRRLNVNSPNAAPTNYNLSAGAIPLADRPSQGNNLSNFFYEYSVEGQYQVFPLLDMSPIPLLGSIPAVAGPSTVKFAATNSVENPKALDN